LDDTQRTFTDEAGHTWLVERVGRTSGIVSGERGAPMPEPADILRFTRTDADEPDRETTIRAGSLADLTEESLRESLAQARKLRPRH